MLDFNAVRISAPGKRVCFWGAPSQFQPVESWQDNLARTGANTGNLFIGNGLFQNTDSDQKSYGLDFANTDPGSLHEKYDYIFIPSSNFLNPSSDFGVAAEFLSKTKLPLFCFGLGSQHLPGRELVLKAGTEKFIRLLSERCGTVGVRGNYTAELMNGMGLKNATVVGCPSLLNLSSAAATSLQARKPSLDKIGVHFSNNVRSHALNPAALRVTENSLFSRATSENAYYIIQNEIQEFQLVAALAAGDEDAVTQSLAALATTFDVAIPNHTFANFLRHHIRCFFSVASWVTAMKTMTACIGSRFHGTIGALLAGTPSLLLAHDMRTLEMAEFFGIPFLLIDRDYSQEALIERLLATDYAPFVGRLTAIQVEWKRFARSNGLDLVPAVTAVAA